MTQHWIDLRNSDCIMIIGSNAAENHPISFKWITEAMEKGAKLISVDPRFTRTSSKADIYGQMRSGTDIAFIGGMIKYCLDHGLYNETYLKECTNACFLINDGFQTCRDLDGVFSGLTGNSYDKSTWQYQLDGDGNPVKVAALEGSDPSYPGCKTAFSLLKEHFSSYTKAKVCEITGVDPDVFEEICAIYCATYSDDKSATIMYAMGTTQHTHGTQNIRSYAILQLLLGNIGVAGGGINALRGESNVQGSTDMCLLFHILPGYLATPDAKLYHKDLDSYIAKQAPTTLDPSGVDGPASANWWQHYGKYISSLLKAWWPDADFDGTNDLKPDNAYQYLPKKIGNCSHISIFENILSDAPNRIRGLMCWGQNPAVGGPNSNKEREALARLDWLVCADLWETETASFWKRPGVNPATIGTEVWMLPAAAFHEKEGSITNSGRWMQWRYEAAPPPGIALSDLEIIRRLGVALQTIAGSGNSLGDLNWGPRPGLNYSAPADPHEVAKEVNGYYLRGHASAGLLVTSFGALQADGTTSSGNWLYCDSYDEDGNKAQRTDLTDAVNGIGLYPGFSWCWPVNRRIIYNRASTYQSGLWAGSPLAPSKWVLRWNGSAWEGDVPDHGAPPGGVYPFIMKPEGHARIFGMGLVDGPFPEHYEPMESPVANAMSSQQNNPTVHIYDATEFNNSGEFPIVGTTYRVSEHWQAGAMTRNLPYLCQLMPNVFCEMSEELAALKGISNGDQVMITCNRGFMEAVACVTKRFKPFQLNGKTVHQIGVVWHYGYQGWAPGFGTGDSANLLTPHVGDPNTRIPEYKAFLCDVNPVAGL